MQSSWISADATSKVRLQFATLGLLMRESIVRAHLGLAREGLIVLGNINEAVLPEIDKLVDTEFDLRTLGKYAAALYNVAWAVRNGTLEPREVHPIHMTKENAKEALVLLQRASLALYQALKDAGLGDSGLRIGVMNTAFLSTIRAEFRDDTSNSVGLAHDFVSNMDALASYILSRARPKK